LQIALSRDGERFAVLRQDMQTIDIHDLADGRHLTALTPPSNVGRIPVAVSFAENDTVISAWTLHVLTRQTPVYVTAHLLPRNLKEALSAAEVRLAALSNTWSPNGSAQPADAK